jgi:hypothetical protein
MRWSVRLVAAPRVVVAAQRALARAGMTVAPDDPAAVVVRLHPGPPDMCEVVVRAGERATVGWLLVARRSSGPEHLGELLGLRIAEFLGREVPPPGPPRPPSGAAPIGAARADRRNLDGATGG